MGSLGTLAGAFIGVSLLGDGLADALGALAGAAGGEPGAGLAPHVEVAGVSAALAAKNIGGGFNFVAVAESAGYARSDTVPVVSPHARAPAAWCVRAVAVSASAWAWRPIAPLSDQDTLQFADAHRSARVVLADICVAELAFQKTTS